MSGFRRAGGLLVAVVLVALAACGAPDHSFVASPDADLVLKLPRSWTAVRNDSSSGAGGQPDGGWSAVFDSSHEPDAQHVDLASSVSSPVAYARVTLLDGESGGSVSGDKLRDMVLPFTTAGRAQYASDPRAATFKRISDYDVRSPVASGVHVVYSYDLGHGREVFDQIAMVGSKSNRVYLLVVRCDQACYDAHQREIREVVDSFTVKVP
ncbi:MAG TPA: hypothetical protein VE781_04830 [Kineosporiaceae bacterium]|jgi:hypothetical protein|nr:hypothetical protein [Kineosporiaceae bacterium]